MCEFALPDLLHTRPRVQIQSLFPEKLFRLEARLRSFSRAGRQRFRGPQQGIQTINVRLPEAVHHGSFQPCWEGRPQADLLRLPRLLLQQHIGLPATTAPGLSGGMQQSLLLLRRRSERFLRRACPETLFRREIAEFRARRPGGERGVSDDTTRVSRWTLQPKFCKSSRIYGV